MTYEVRPMRASDEPAVLQLLEQSLAAGPTGERTADFFRWKHRENHFGRSVGLVASDATGVLAAVRLLMRWELTVHGARLRAVRAVDTATSPLHQGRGLFRQLTLCALEGDARDADLVFNTPNAQSRPGYLKMGWVEVGQVPISVRPLRPFHVLRGLRRSGQQSVAGPQAPVFSPLPTAHAVLTGRASEITALLEEAEAGADTSRLRTPRSMDYLLWRYGNPPGLDYRAVVVDGSAGLRGIAFGRLRRRGPLSELTLGDVLVRPGDRAVARALLRRTRHARTDLVATTQPEGSVAAGALRSSAFLRVPGRGLTLTSNARRTLPVDATRMPSWGLSLGDLELF